MEHMSVAEFKKSESGAPDPRRQLIGKQNRASGEIFEGKVIAACELYKNRGAAYIEKTPEPLKVIGVLNRLKEIFKAIFTKRAQPDFKGTLAGGRSICFEAKHTDADRIEKKVVTAEQEKALNMHSSLGAVCFVIVSIGMQDFYRVPWAVWKDMKTLFRHQYMNAAELEPYRLKVVYDNILFLSGLEEKNESHES